MPNNNRGAERDRKSEGQRRPSSDSGRTFSSNDHDIRARGIARVNAGRDDRRRSDTENDLYERQSI